MKRYRILDYFCHGGAQYELFKTGHDFYVVGLDSKRPNWNVNNRPLLPNVRLITEQEAFKKNYDIVIVRSPLNPKRYEPFMSRGAAPVAVIQTTSVYVMSKYVRQVVWNCEETMKKFSQHHYPDKKHHHIVHGFDPEEFKNLHLERIPRVLSVANVFKRRSEIMGYELWRKVNDRTGLCDLVGHGNEDINPDFKEAATFQELVKLYNSYQIFWNTTKDSAMPRSRGEFLMTGGACISTNTHAIGRYFSHMKNIVFADSLRETVEAIELLLNNPSLREDLGARARETAIKHFHIKDFIEKWNYVFDKAKLR